MPGQSQSSSRFPRGFGGSGFGGGAFGGSGFGPLFGGGQSDLNMRVSDAERQAVADRLAEHYGDGRLDKAEWEERAGRAMSAKTRADLNGLFDDLPEPGPAGASGVPSGVQACAPGGAGRGVPGGGVLGGGVLRGRRRMRGHPVLAVVLIGVIALAIAHSPWLLLFGFFTVIVLVATGHLGRSRPSRDQ